MDLCPAKDTELAQVRGHHRRGLACSPQGQHAYQVIWEPLLRGKFGECYAQAGMTWLWGKIYLRVASLGKSLQKETVRGIVCVMAQKFGVDLDDVIGSKPESDLYLDCSPKQIQKVHRGSVQAEKLFPERLLGCRRYRCTTGFNGCGRRTLAHRLGEHPGGRSGWPAG